MLKMEDQWREMIFMFFHNLSPYYVLCVTVSIFAISFSVWYSRKCQKEMSIKGQFEDDLRKDGNLSSDDPLSFSEIEGEISLPSDGSSPIEALQSRIKVARHQAIVNHLSSTMTPAQLKEEKEIEKAQLAAILNLLKEQQEKFNVSDMGELEEQLSLYR